MEILQTLTKLIIILLFLTLSLWWSLTDALVYMSARWMPKSFFRFQHEKEAHFELSILDANIFEASIFSTFALPGYLSVTNGGTGILSGVGGWSRYFWFSLIPWLITFAQSWLTNIHYFLCNVTSAFEATNFWVFIGLWLLGFVVQALLWSEVLCVAWQGWILMRNENRVEQTNLLLALK